MPGFTVYAANKLTNHLLGIAAYTMPSGVYLKMHLGDPGPDGTANPSTMTTRVLATWTPAASNAPASLAADLSWVLSAREPISHVSAWDSLTAGNCLFTDILEETKNMYSGDTFTLPNLNVGIKADA